MQLLIRLFVLSLDKEPEIMSHFGSHLRLVPGQTWIPSLWSPRLEQSCCLPGPASPPSGPLLHLEWCCHRFECRRRKPCLASLTLWSCFHSGYSIVLLSMLEELQLCHQGHPFCRRTRQRSRGRALDWASTVCTPATAHSLERTGFTLSHTHSHIKTRSSDRSIRQGPVWYWQGPPHPHSFRRSTHLSAFTALAQAATACWQAPYTYLTADHPSSPSASFYSQLKDFEAKSANLVARGNPKASEEALRNARGGESLVATLSALAASSAAAEARADATPTFDAPPAATITETVVYTPTADAAFSSYTAALGSAAASLSSLLSKATAAPSSRGGAVKIASAGSAISFGSSSSKVEALPTRAVNKGSGILTSTQAQASIATAPNESSQSVFGGNGATQKIKIVRPSQAAASSSNAASASSVAQASSSMTASRAAVTAEPTAASSPVSVIAGTPSRAVKLGGALSSIQFGDGSLETVTTSPDAAPTASASADEPTSSASVSQDVSSDAAVPTVSSDAAVSSSSDVVVPSSSDAAGATSAAATDVPISTDVSSLAASPTAGGTGSSLSLPAATTAPIATSVADNSTVPATTSAPSNATMTSTAIPLSTLLPGLNTTSIIANATSSVLNATASVTAMPTNATASITGIRTLNATSTSARSLNATSTGLSSLNATATGVRGLNATSTGIRSLNATSSISLPLNATSTRGLNATATSSLNMTRTSTSMSFTSTSTVIIGAGGSTLSGTQTDWPATSYTAHDHATSTATSSSATATTTISANPVSTFFKDLPHSPTNIVIVSLGALGATVLLFASSAFALRRFCARNKGRRASSAGSEAGFIHDDRSGNFFPNSDGQEPWDALTGESRAAARRWSLRNGEEDAMMIDPFADPRSPGSASSAANARMRQRSPLAIRSVLAANQPRYAGIREEEEDEHDETMSDHTVTGPATPRQAQPPALVRQQSIPFHLPSSSHAAAGTSEPVGSPTSLHRNSNGSTMSAASQVADDAVIQMHSGPVPIRALSIAKRMPMSQLQQQPSQQTTTSTGRSSPQSVKSGAGSAAGSIAQVIRPKAAALARHKSMASSMWSDDTADTEASHVTAPQRTTRSARFDSLTNQYYQIDPREEAEDDESTEADYDDVQLHSPTQEHALSPPPLVSSFSPRSSVSSLG
ncbi:hypothetical protein E5Q_05195 [Mixia osmundae IAM 14324]|uniref:Uncharacterized protein n=1 Tax=Mixia osmundae (strain CBS 9802 / IAM 14324 / JCM 22182 / KY 12970) TaxID=764103 RepID=G7E6P9_MIXOS|nr:hypothetical protein E5Q_05195 [Mixia osmundae IAM 14324]